MTSPWATLRARACLLVLLLTSTWGPAFAGPQVSSRPNDPVCPVRAHLRHRFQLVRDSETPDRHPFLIISSDLFNNTNNNLVVGVPISHSKRASSFSIMIEDQALLDQGVDGYLHPHPQGVRSVDWTQRDFTQLTKQPITKELHGQVLSVDSGIRNYRFKL